MKKDKTLQETFTEISKSDPESVLVISVNSDNKIDLYGWCMEATSAIELMEQAIEEIEARIDILDPIPVAMH